MRHFVRYEFATMRKSQLQAKKSQLWKWKPQLWDTVALQDTVNHNSEKQSHSC